MTAVQIPIPSSDITGAVLSIKKRRIVLLAVYIPPQDSEVLYVAIELIKQAIYQVRRENRGTQLDILILGDFNRHDYLWGGDKVSENRQGEVEPIIDLIANFHLQSLLPRGTPTWQRDDYETTIDLVLASSDISEARRKCEIYPIEHGSDHRAIVANFDIYVPEQVPQVRY